MGRTRHKGDVGWMVHQDYIGVGIATMLLRAVLNEAKKKGFERAEAETVNTASIRFAKRTGFKIGGRRRPADPR